MTVGERIKERRKELGISVDEVAAKLGKNRATVYRYESNSIENLPAQLLEPLADILKTTPAQLLGIPEGVDADSVLVALQDSESGRTHALDEMFRLYGKGYGASSTRRVDDNLAVLYYRAFPDRNSAVAVSNLLDLLDDASGDDLDAIIGMVSGFLKRKRRKKKSAVPGTEKPETTDTEDMEDTADALW